jgi:GDP-L-fucose synthase
MTEPIPSSCFMNVDSRVYIAGHSGLVGSAIHRALIARGYRNLIVRRHSELDLMDEGAVLRFFDRDRPQFVFMAAAKVGGILANQNYPAEFLRQNLIMETNVIEASRRVGVERLLFLGSSCIYPKFATQPMNESCLLTGPLESTNRPYAIAKIAGIEMCWSYNRQYGTKYIAAMPSNLYGPRDNFDLETSHLLPALIRKTIEAKLSESDHIVVWGSGRPRRELLHSSDAADACIFLMNLDPERFGTLLAVDRPPLINIGTGEDVTVRRLAALVAKVVNFRGDLVFDPSKPDGTPRKLLDVQRIHDLGWYHKISLEDGIRETCEWYLNKPSSAPGLTEGETSRQSGGVGSNAA